MSTDPNQIINSITSLPEDTSNPLDTGNPNVKTTGLSDFYKGTEFENSKPDTIYKGNVNPYYSEAQKIDLSTVYTDPTDSYLDYDVPLDPFAEWNDIRAENQNIGEKIMYGGIKMVGTGVGAILENTAGVIGGLGSMASGGTYSNNPIGRGVDEMNEWLAENLPHYYTQRELDPDRAWYDNLGDANFWTDKFANGVGYLLGSIGTIALTGGSGLITRGAAAGLAASESIGTIAGAISKGEKIKNIYNASKIIKSGAKLSDDIATQALKARGLNAIKNIEIGTMMSMGEASVEAREKSKSYIEERFTDWEENNPGKIARRDMPLWMQEEIYNDARSLENATFGLNLALLVPTNLMQASVLLGNKFLGKITADKIVGDIVKKEGKFIAAETASGISGKLSRLNDIAAPIYKSKLTEAFQEGAQFFIGAAGSEYFKNKFDTGVEDLGLAISKGLSQTLGSADGQESMLIGALIGGFGGAISTTFGAEAAKRKLTKENTNRLVQLMNSSIFIDVKNEMEKSQEASRILSALKASREIGNDILSDQLMKEYIFMRASKLREVGAEDLGITEIDDLKNLSDEEFSKRIGLDPAKKIEDQTGGKSKNMLIDDYIKEYKKAIKLDEDLEAIVESMNPSNFGAPDLLKSKDRKYRDSVNRYYNSKLKTILMSNLTSIDTIDTSLDETLKKLKEISPEFEAINVDDLLLFVKKNKIEITSDGKVEIPEGLTTTEITDVEAEKAKESGIKETDKTKEKFKTLFRGAIEKSKNYDPLKKDKFENYINTFLKLAASREEAIAAFEELRRNPEARQTAILAKEAKIKESKAINDSKDADVIIDKARSTADLEELINNENLSPEMKAKVKKKYDDLRKVEDDYFRDFVDLPDNVLIEDLLKNIEEIQNANPQMALALLRVLESRRSETSEEKAKKQTTSYEDDINKKFETEPAADTKNTTKYKNNINVSSAALNKIFINGNLYDIKYSDITSAVVLREDSTVESVTLHLANTGQEVIFKDSQDNPIATEIAEVLFTMAAANTSKDSSNTTIEDIERASEVFYNKFITTKSVIDNRIENVKKSQDSALISGMIESIDQNINQMSLFTESIKKAYIANSQDIKNSDIYAKLKSIVDEYLVKKGELQKIYRTLNKLEDTINNQNVAVKNLSEQEEKELQNEINKLQKEIDEIQDRLQAIDEELSETTDEAIAQALSEEAQSLVIELNSKEALRQTKITLYENRKSSKAGPDVSDPTKSPEDTEEQGPDGQGEGDSEVLKDETDTTDLASLIKESLNMSGSINLSPTDEGEEVDTTTDNPISNYSPSDEPPIEDTKNPINNLNGEILNVRIINTEYQSPDEDYDYIIVDKNGKPIPNEQYETIKKNNKVNGDTINIKQNLLTSESEVPTGSKLTFVFRDTDWWKVNKTNTEEDWKRAPIYVYINYGEDNEQAVGMLEAFREGESEITSDRKKIYEALQSGKKVESILGRKLEGKEGKTIANAVDKDGNTYFYDIYTDPVAPPNLVIKTDSDGWVQVTGPETFSDAELAEFLQRTADNGSVGLVTFDSSGNPQLLKLQTEKIGGVDGKNDYAYKIIEKLIKENNFSELSKIIGFNLIKDSGEFDVNKSLVLEENINTGSGSKYLYTFYHDAAESYVRVSGEELSKALNGKTFKYSFVDIESEYTDNNKLIYNIVPKDKDNDDYKKYAKTIVTNFKNKVKNKRFQVDINQFSSNEIFETPLRPGKLYNSYLEYLTEEDPNIKALGHKSILKSDIYINELGSPNYNIGIEFKSLIIDGKLQDSNETYSPFSENSGEMDSEDTPQSNDTTEETGEGTSNPYAAFGDELFEEKTEDSTKQTFESKQSFEDKAETAEDASNPTSEETGKKVFTEEEAKEFTSQEDKLLKELKRVYDEEVVKDSKSNKPKMHVDPKTQEEDAYIIKPFDETFEDNYRRITKLAGEPFTGDPKLRDASTKVGTTIHELAEKILLKLPYERPQNLSRVAFLEFKVEISKVARTIQSRKETIIATEMVVYSKKPQFAGKFDILVKTQKGGYHIYDIKTGTQKGLNDYDKTHTNKDTKRTTRSKRDQHGAQLSLYAYALRGMADRANIPINKKELITGSVLYFPLEYTETGEITKVLESKEKKFILNFDAYKVIKDKPSFEIKKDSTGDPSLDNAGTKKGGNTAKSNRGKEKEDTDEESKTKSKGTKSGVASKKFKSPDGSRSITLQEFSNILDYYLDNNEVDANLTETIKKIQKDIKTSIKNDEMDNSRGLQEFVQGVIDSLQTSDIKDLLGSNGYQIPSSDDFTNKLDEYIDNEEIRKICNS